MAEQNRQIAHLTNRINAQESMKMTNKCLIAIQDLNATDFLEKSDFFSKPVRHKLFELRDKRNDKCHFILDDDSADFKTHKFQDLLNHLQNCNPQTKQQLQKLTGGIIPEIENYLTEKLKDSVLVSLSEWEEFCLSNWWIQ